MGILGFLILIALVFALCFAADKGFTKLFRSKKEHASGLSVRHSSRTAAFGVIAGVVGVATLLEGQSGGALFYAGGAVVLLVGAILVIQYLSFGIYYMDEGFLVNTFGKPGVRYGYGDILGQRLYNSQGNLVIELHMKDGNAVMLQSSMKNVYPFLDHAFQMWLQQTGRRLEDCVFHDPDNSCWFPNVEG